MSYIKFIAMEFQPHIVVTSQSMNKNLRLPHPLALFTNKVNA
jgi:hypothetical protein